MPSVFLLLHVVGREMDHVTVDWFKDIWQKRFYRGMSHCLFTGHPKIVECLLKAKVDTECKMGDLTAMDIARDFGQEEILTLFEEHNK